MTDGIILTTAAELREIVAEEVRAALRDTERTAPEEPLSDDMTVEEAAAFLSGHADPSTPARLRNLAYREAIPCSRRGRRLVFSRRDLLQWLEARKVTRNRRDEAVLTLAKGARRKQRP